VGHVGEEQVRGRDDRGSVPRRTDPALVGLVDLILEAAVEVAPKTGVVVAFKPSGLAVLRYESSRRILRRHASVPNVPHRRCHVEVLGAEHPELR